MINYVLWPVFPFQIRPLAFWKQRRLPSSYRAFDKSAKIFLRLSVFKCLCESKPHVIRKIYLGTKEDERKLRFPECLQCATCGDKIYNNFSKIFKVCVIAMFQCRLENLVCSGSQCLLFSGPESQLCSTGEQTSILCTVLHHRRAGSGETLPVAQAILLG